MKVTINYGGQLVSVEVSVEVYEFLDCADHNAYCYFSLHHQAGTAQQGKICRCRCCISQWDKAGQRVGRHDA